MGPVPCLLDLAPTGFSKGELGYISPAWNSSLYSVSAGGPWFFPFALCLYVGGRRAWKCSLQKCAWYSGRQGKHAVL